jgi:hypothetical protein
MAVVLKVLGVSGVAGSAATKIVRANRDNPRVLPLGTGTVVALWKSA